MVLNLTCGAKLTAQMSITTVKRGNVPGVIACKPRPTQADPCSIYVTDLADIFTGYRTKCLRKNLKISAQIDDLFRRYRGCKYGGVGLFWGTF